MANGDFFAGKEKQISGSSLQRYGQAAKKLDQNSHNSDLKYLNKIYKAIDQDNNIVGKKIEFNPNK